MGQAELQRAVAEVLKRAGFDATCASCGSSPAGPNPGFLIVEKGAPLRSCDACGFLLDQRGQPVGSREEDGTFRGRIIILARQRDEPGRNAWPFVGAG